MEKEEQNRNSQRKIEAKNKSMNMNYRGSMRRRDFNEETERLRKIKLKNRELARIVKEEG